MWDWIKRWILQDKTAQGRFEATRMVQEWGWHYAVEQYAHGATGDEYDQAFWQRLKELAPPEEKAKLKGITDGNAKEEN